MFLIKYQPDKLLEKIAPQSKIKKLISKSFSLKKTALNFIDSSDIISKDSIEDVALKTIKEYKKRIKLDEELEGDLKKEPKLLINRVQNAVVFQISQEIGSKYKGEKYRWLPSDADEPDPEHQVKYGEIFIVGEGEMPGERYGCRCGMEILTEDEKLEI